MARKQLVPLDMNTNKVTNLGTPTSGTDAATKDYVDANSGGSPSVRREILDGQTISFTDDIVYVESSVSTIYLPHDTTGHTGKRITIGSLNGPVDIIEVINPSPLSISTVTLYKVFDLVVLEAQPYGALSNNWQVVERIENVTDRIVDSETNTSVLYVPYVGASTDIDASGVSLKITSVIGPDDTGISVGAGAQVTPNTSGGDASLGGGFALGNGNGGRAILSAGNADTSGGFDGDGGHVYIQAGEHAGSGVPGWFEFGRSSKAEYLKMDIENLTANREVQFPDADGELIVKNSGGLITNAQGVVGTAGWGIFSGGDGTGWLKTSTLSTSREYQLPDTDGNIALQSYVDDEISSIDLSGYVPYTGATNDLDMTGNAITASDFYGEEIGVSSGGNGYAVLNELSLIFGTSASGIQIGQDPLKPNVLQIRKGDVSSELANIDVDGLTAERTFELPDASGTIALISDIPAGGGDVEGPASSTNNALALFDGTTGKLLKDNDQLRFTPGTGGGASLNFAVGGGEDTFIDSEGDLYIGFNSTAYNLNIHRDTFISGNVSANEVWTEFLGGYDGPVLTFSYEGAATSNIEMKPGTTVPFATNPSIGVVGTNISLDINASGTGSVNVEGVAIKDGLVDGVDVANTVTRVVHGSNASMARPSGINYVEWVGSVAPTNATANDTWVDTN